MANDTCWEDARLTNGAATASAEGTRDPERTRRLILQSASALFAKYGPDVATVEQIARGAGYSKRMVYHYFGSKQSLYQAVIKSVYGRVTRVTAESADGAVGLVEVVDRLLQEYFLFLQKNPEFVALLNWENSHDVKGLKQVDLRAFIDPVCEVVRAALEREQQGNLEQKGKPVDDLQVAHVIMTCLALCGYYFSNRKSMSALFKINLSEPAQEQRWLDHVRSLVVQGVSCCCGEKQV